jgi:hypothetical protein
VSYSKTGHRSAFINQAATIGRRFASKVTAISTAIGIDRNLVLSNSQGLSLLALYPGNDLCSE